MKRFASALLLSTLIAVAAFAADTGSGKIHLDAAVKVGTNELPAGDYKVTWTGPAQNSQVTLTQGKTTVTTSAQVESIRRNADGIGTKSENGSRILTEIQFRDKTLVLQTVSSQIAGQ